MRNIVQTDDTIVAISTPVGRSGIGVVRLTGAQAESIVSKFLKSKTPLAHCQAVGGLWVEESGALVDEVMATLFRAPRSYTGEDVVEISAHGNPLILKRIVESVRSAGGRMAQPGEFTLRSVIHGKRDLIQAEAVRNFIDAQTEAQARMALSQMGGALSKRISPTKERLIDIIAHLEAGIDFADDDGAPPDAAGIAESIGLVCGALLELQQSYAYGKLLSEGLRIAIVGKPNVGKSSLFNRFVGADRAIVASIPGTTRDILNESVSLDGIPLKFSDTAGLRETEDPVEKIGVERAMEALSEADLVLVVVDGSEAMDDRDGDILKPVERTRRLVVVNKCDLPRRNETVESVHGIHVSAKTGEGIQVLKDAIRAFLKSRADGAPDSMVTSARQFENVSGAIAALEKAKAAMAEGTPHEMVLLDIYGALSHLNELTGEVVTDDILERIFSTFCLGK